MLRILLLTSKQNENDFKGFLEGKIIIEPMKGEPGSGPLLFYTTVMIGRKICKLIDDQIPTRSLLLEVQIPSSALRKLTSHSANV
jgi:hypothetical protein